MLVKEEKKKSIVCNICDARVYQVSKFEDGLVQNHHQ
jgi:hypothetical protein